MHYLNEEHLLTFLVQVLVLLGMARVLGELCQQRGIPALAGEIATGILLGPTILGRIAPTLEAQLFPADLVQRDMLETVSWFGVLFLLLATGFEVSIRSVWKQGKACLTIGVVGVVVPFVLGCGVFYWLPSQYWGENANQGTFTLFLATAAAISAIPVIARVLHDLEILKSDFGLTTLSAFVVNDIIGWIVFTMVLGVVHPSGSHGLDPMRVFYEIVLFGAVCLTVGSKIVGAINARLVRTGLPQPGTTLTFIVCLGLLCGAITQWTGVHAILGFFLAGIMAGNAPEISENTRQIISQTIHAIFVPVFFATIGIKLDFLANFDVLIVLLVTVVAIGGKFLGAALGAHWAGVPRDDVIATGIAHIPGGAMEIVLGMLALEVRLISEDVFVAVIFAAISSSVAVGPLLAWSIRRREKVDVGGLLWRAAVSTDLRSVTRWETLREIAGQISAADEHLDEETLFNALRAREKLMGTALAHGVAVPHARLDGLERPIVAFGLSKQGLDWDAPDGQPTHYVFCILTPRREEGLQVQILGAIARVMTESDVPERLMRVRSPKEAYTLLNEALALDSLVKPAQAS